MSDYHAALDGKAEGPFSRARVIEMIASGRIAPDTPLWRSGMEDWAPASSLVEFSGHFAARAADAAPPPADAPDANRPRLAAASRRLELGRAIDDAVAAFKRAPWRVSLGAGIYIGAAFAANTLAFSRLLPGAGAEAADAAPPIPWEMGLWLVGGIVFGVVLRAGFCVFTLRVLRGEAASLALVFAGLGRAPTLAAYALLYAAAVFAGLLFFILPGIVLAVGFSLGFYVIMESRLGALAAMRESWRAVLELGLLRVSAVYLAGFVGVLFVGAISGATAAVFGAPPQAELLSRLVLAALWAGVTALVVAAVYEQARRNKERGPGA